MNFLFSGAKTFNELFHDKSGSNICLQHHNFSIISHLSGAKLIFINSFVIKEAAILVYSVIILFHYWIIVAPPGGILNYNMDILQHQQNRSVCIELWEKDCLVPRSLSTELSPSHSPLRFVTSNSRFAFASVWKNEAASTWRGGREKEFLLMFNELEHQSLKAFPA